VAVLPLLALGLAACGGSSAKPMQIEFGIQGGNVGPVDVIISPQGVIDWNGPVRYSSKRVSSSTAASLSQLVRADFAAGLPSRPKRCPGTLPDIGTQFVRAEGRTVLVHGGCDPRFTQLWNRLADAVRLSH
jgi:hypothetical protein